MALGSHGAIRVIDHVDVLNDLPVVTLGGENLLVGLTALGAGVAGVAALKTSGSRVNGLLPVVLAGGGGIGGRGRVLNDVLVAVGDVVVGDRHAIVTELHRDGGTVLQRDEVGAGLVIVRPLLHNVDGIGGHVVVVVGGLVDDGRVVVVVVGDTVVVVAVEVVYAGVDEVVVGDQGCICRVYL